MAAFYSAENIQEHAPDFYWHGKSTLSDLAIVTVLQD